MKAGNRYDWTDERVAMLRRLHRQGLTDADIANRLGTTPRSVNGKRDRLGLMRRRDSGAVRLRVIGADPVGGEVD